LLWLHPSFSSTSTSCTSITRTPSAFVSSRQSAWSW
jgi:hypothetical protein